MRTLPAPDSYQEALATQQLTQFLAGDTAGAAALLAHLEWVELSSGETLMEQGQAGDSMYLVISGRLRAYVQDGAAPPCAVRELARGQVIGEMSLYTGDPRTATVVAIRDTVLVRLGKAGFVDLLSQQPTLSMALTKQAIQRLQTQRAPHKPTKPITIALLGITPDLDLPAFALALAELMRAAGRVQVVDSAWVVRQLRSHGLDVSDAPAALADGTQAAQRLGPLLEAAEAEHDFVLLVADALDTPWSRRCARHCDELLLLADTRHPARLHPIESDYLMQRPARAEAAQVLVLLHAPETPTPRNTLQWLNRRPVTDHVHLRRGSQRDLARLARLQTRTAVGLVLAGGGARGLGHLGVYRALQEQGIEVDCVGGTSIGAAMAALVAADRPLEHMLRVARSVFLAKPTSDFNWLPIISLIRGRRMRQLIDVGLHDLLGPEPQVEDLWRNFFCIATNYSHAREMVLRQGDLSRALRASVAIPGALPPVVLDGDLLCDGGTFNNFPVDVMRRMRGVGTVIGVDLSLKKARPLELAETPDAWDLLRDKLLRQRRYRLPSMATLLINATILYSVSRQREHEALTDLYFNPPLPGVGMLEWHKLDAIVQQAYEHSAAALQDLNPEMRQRLQSGPTH